MDAVNRETAAMDAPKPASSRAVALQLAEACPGDRERPELEAFVRAAFARSHAAQVQTFMPSLLGFRDGQQRLRGVLGLRAAAAAPLYLEHYLDQPVEDAIAGATGQPLRMIAQLPAYLLARDFGWIVFTATRTVRQILLGFGAPLVELARADGARVADGVDAWGGYYDNDPRVFAGYLPESWRLAAFTRGGQDH